MNKFNWLDKKVSNLNNTFLVFVFFRVWVFIRRFFSRKPQKKKKKKRKKKKQYKKRHMGNKPFPRIYLRKKIIN